MMGSTQPPRGGIVPCGDLKPVPTRLAEVVEGEMGNGQLHRPATCPQGAETALVARVHSGEVWAGQVALLSPQNGPTAHVQHGRGYGETT